MSTSTIVLGSLCILLFALLVLVASRLSLWKLSSTEWQRSARKMYDKYMEEAGKLDKERRIASDIAARYKAKDQECERLRGEKSAINARYEELLMSVRSKFDREKRHDTALRYIREREATASAPQMEAKLGR